MTLRIQRIIHPRRIEMFASESTKDLLDFDGMRDDLDSAPIKRSESAMFVEKCAKCNGSGIYYGFSSHGRHCFACDGKGSTMFKTSPEQREKARLNAAKKKVSKAEGNLADFEAEYPGIAAWWTNSTFEFAVAMRASVIKWGGLTANQMEATKRCVDKFNAAKVARESRLESAASVDISGLEAAFRKGQSNKIKKPKLRLAEGHHSFVFSLAPTSGKNSGAVYVVSEEQYLGKIISGKFVRAFDCSEEFERSVIAACVDPLQAAVAYGRRFGICSCCGRELTNGESIDLGIGPICRSKFF